MRTRQTIRQTIEPASHIVPTAGHAHRRQFSTSRDRVRDHIGAAALSPPPVLRGRVREGAWGEVLSCEWWVLSECLGSSSAARAGVPVHATPGGDDRTWPSLTG